MGRSHLSPSGGGGTQPRINKQTKGKLSQKFCTTETKTAKKTKNNFSVSAKIGLLEASAEDLGIEQKRNEGVR